MFHDGTLPLTMCKGFWGTLFNSREY